MKKALRQLTFTLILSTLSLSLIQSGYAIAGDIVVITHPSVGVTELSKEDVMRIFLAKTKTYPNEKQAVPVIPKENADTRKRFESVVFQKSPVQIKAYWTRLLFTGRGNPPQALEDDAAIKKRVAETPNAIGYIDASALDTSVRAVFTIQ